MGLRGGRNRKYTLAEKLAARIIKQPSGCWEVQGHVLPNGYVYIDGSIGAHVVAWELANGKRVPDGLEVMHTCDNARCANPEHLRVGTHRENILDSIHKGRYNCFGRQKLDASKVLDIRAMADLGFTQKDIGRQFGVGRSCISAVVNGKTWSHVAPSERTA